MTGEGANKPTSVSREELYRQVWETPMQRLAARYGISGNGLAKICDRLGVPYPPRGYWAKRDAKKPVKQLPLPPLAADTPTDVVITPTPRLPPPPPPAMSPEVRQRYEAALQQASSIQVPDSLRKPHLVIAERIAQHAREVAAAKRDRYASAFAPKPFTAIDNRRHRILDTLFKELEKLGFKVQTDTRRATWLETGRERVDFTLGERVRQVRQPITPEQSANLLYARQRWTQVKVPTGQLVFRISTYLGTGITQEWSDQEDKPLEEQIGDIVATLSLAGPLLKQQRELAEEPERQRLEAEHQRQKPANQRRRENNRWRRFLELADRWTIAESARRFLTVLENQPASEQAFGGRTHDEWLAWAKTHLTEYDPLLHGIDAIWDNLAQVSHWEYRD